MTSYALLNLFGFMKCFWHNTTHGLINLHIYSTSVLEHMSLPGGEKPVIILKGLSLKLWPIFTVCSLCCVPFIPHFPRPFSWPG